MFSVLLSVYRKEKATFLRQALTSVYHEQTLKPNQIVVVKDGLLTNELEKVIAEWQSLLGEILTVVSLPNNLGLGAALNKGLAHCKYELVARMDADDISMPSRFQKQVAFMQENPHITACSAQIEEWNVELTRKLDQRILPTDPIAVAHFAKRRSPLSHPVSIFRKSIILKVGGYPPLRKAQDFALWSLLLVKGYNLANLSETLLKMRTGNVLLERRGWSYFKRELQLLQFQREIGFLSTFDYITNAALRAALRLPPNFIKNLVYRLAR